MHQLYGIIEITKTTHEHEVKHMSRYFNITGCCNPQEHYMVNLDSRLAQIKKMGNLKELASMIPGVGKAIKDIDIDDNAFKSIEAIIYSMTPEERSNPAILNGSRRQRIAKGSGTNIQEVNRLLKQFDQTRKMMKMVTGSKMGKMMPKLKR